VASSRERRLYHQQRKEDALNESDKARVSEGLGRLSERAKKAEERVATAWSEEQEAVQRSANEARAAAQAHADKLSETAGADRAHVSESWNETQQSWRDHLAKMDENLRGAKTAVDVEAAENRAEDAAGDAVTAIDYAYGAIEEVEAAVLDAISARKEVDELIQTQ
jgi:hypothetical protein